ncbi:MAG: DUF881 domain-containing protein [Syntrophomonadaceae bacterium]|nr:DUF881 domain-containing protein [Syntrophomonadaceae bacterium]
MRSKTGQVSIMIVCLVLGIMLAVQFKNTQNSEVNLRGARTDEVYVRLMEVTEERDALAKEVLSLREKVINVSNDNNANRELQEEMQKANMAAGLLPVYGQGIVVTLNDSARTVQMGEDPNSLLVHDSDIMSVVSELKASGAEAISVNGERIIAMSEIRCAGTTILVNTNRIAPPFIVKAIGDPQMLESGLTIKGGVAQKLKDYGLQIQIQKSENVEIPAYTGVIKMKFSQPNK